jgi:hypothetical protein
MGAAMTTGTEIETDIVERLRRSSIPFWYHERPRLVQEAADEIERLRAGLAQTAQQPVAWRWRLNGGNWYLEEKSDDPEMMSLLEKDGYEFQALYTLSDTSTDRPSTYIEVCKNPTCPRGGAPVEIVGSATEAMRNRNLGVADPSPEGKIK